MPYPMRCGCFLVIPEWAGDHGLPLGIRVSLARDSCLPLRLDRKTCPTKEESCHGGATEVGAATSTPSVSMEESRCPCAQLCNPSAAQASTLVLMEETTKMRVPFVLTRASVHSSPSRTTAPNDTTPRNNCNEPHPLSGTGDCHRLRHRLRRETLRGLPTW